MTSKIYTRTGDKGMTSLVGGKRISKSSIRLDAYGTIDEANSQLGVVIANIQSLLKHKCVEQPSQLEILREVLLYISNKLFNCSSNIAHGDLEVNESLLITPQHVQHLESAIDYFEQHTGPMDGFVLCTGTQLAAQLHVARTVIRRAERTLCKLFEIEPGDENVAQFVNRCSDVFFAAARFSNWVLNTKAPKWQKDVPFPSLK